MPVAPENRLDFTRGLPQEQGLVTSEHPLAHWPRSQKVHWNNERERERLVRAIPSRIVLLLQVHDSPCAHLQLQAQRATRYYPHLCKDLVPHPAAVRAPMGGPATGCVSRCPQRPAPHVSLQTNV